MRPRPPASTAMQVLEEALRRCRVADVRSAKVAAALETLAIDASAQWPFDRFRRALDCWSVEADSLPEARWQTANASLNGIRRVMTRR